MLGSASESQALSAIIAHSQAGTAVRRGKSVLMMCGAARYPLIYTSSQDSLSWNISGSWPSFFTDHRKLELRASQFQMISSINETHVIVCEATAVVSFRTAVIINPSGLTSSHLAVERNGCSGAQDGLAHPFRRLDSRTICQWPHS